MEEPVLRVEGLGKRYRLGPRLPYRTLRESLSRRPGPAGPEFWALRDVSFQAAAGEVVGIIGRNGAGKSTLLKILSRITEPTEGKAEIRGRVGSLLEVGTGMHPELTGRENIFLNAAILGMSRRDVLAKLDEIVAFAEVEAFLDTPLKHYSSGMAMRLAFAVAAHLEPDVLIVDEVLAVGDSAFQKKCMGKMGAVAKSGRTILFVSHNLAAVQNLCRSAYLLENGRVTAGGPVAETVQRYLLETRDARPEDLSARNDRQGDGKLRFHSFSTSSLACGSDASLRIGYHASTPLGCVQITLGLFTSLGEGALFLDSELSGQELSDLPKEGILECRIGKLPLLPGTYSVNVHCLVNGILSDWIVDAARFEVAEGDFFGTGRLPPAGYGSVAVEHEWRATP